MPDQRVEIRQAKAEPIFEDLEAWLHAQLPKLSGKSELAKAIRYALTRMKKLRPYLAHGFLEADNNCAERSMKPVALGRKNYLFVGPEGGSKSAAIAYTLIETAKLNGVDPQPWLTDIRAASPTTRSPVSTNFSPGITLPPQRNQKPPRRARAPSPDGHHARSIAHATEPPMRRTDEEREPVPVAGDEER